MGRNRNSMDRWLFGLQDNMAAHLMDLCISPAFAQEISEVLPVQVSG